MHREHAPRLVRFVFTLAVLGTAASLMGCAQLGIARTEDMTAMDTKQTRANNATNSRVDALDEQVKNLDPQMQALAAQVDSLNASVTSMSRNVTSMRDWLKDLDIDDISAKATHASATSATMSEHFESMRGNHLKRLQAQYEALGAEIEQAKALKLPKEGGAKTGSAKKEGSGDKAAGGEKSGG